ncbi:MAG: hypothetical protein WCY25_01400 [Moheibacter sp.]
MKNLNKPIFLIGIGIFFYLATAGFAFLLKDILRILLLHFDGVHPIIVKVFSELVYFLFFLTGISVLLNILKNRIVQMKNLFFQMIVLTAFGQVIQFIGSYFLFRFYRDNYFVNSSAYFEFMNQNPAYYTLDAGFEYLIYVVLGIMIYKNRDLVLNFDSNSNSKIQEIGKKE